MASVRSVYRIGQMSVRRFSSASKVPKEDWTNHPDPNFAEFKKMQEFFQKDDGVPVHLKKGFSDKVIMYTIFGLCGFGIYQMQDFLRDAAMRP